MHKEKISKFLQVLFLLMIFLIQILYITRGGYLYGENYDWTAQHVTLPDYMRQQFYSTGKLFPDFAMNLGSGQNIYYTAYYGLYSPIVLFSYLLPFIPMRTYMTGASIFVCALSIVLIFRWLSKHTCGMASFAASLMFTLAVPVMYHSHHHLMFVNYLPFLILAMEGIEKYFYEKKTVQLVISVFFTVMSSYFFSPGAVISLVIYWLYLFIKERRHNLIHAVIRTAGVMLIPVLMSAMLWLPVLSIMFSGRAESNNNVSFSDMILPSFQAGNILYDETGFGFSAVFILCTAWLFISRKRENIFAGTVILVFMFFSLPVYILNGGMYVNGKVLIPFLPFVVLMAANFFDSTLEGNYSPSLFLLSAFILNVFIFVLWPDKNKDIDFYIKDLVLSFFMLYASLVLSQCAQNDRTGNMSSCLYPDHHGLSQRTQSDRAAASSSCLHFNRNIGRHMLSSYKLSFIRRYSVSISYFLIILSLMPSLFICYTVNRSDNLLSKADDVSLIYKKDTENLLETVKKLSDGNIMRTDLYYNTGISVNYVFNRNQFRSTFYSSLNNKNYHDYYFSGSGNEISGRSNASIRASSNPLNAMRLGVRFIIGSKKHTPVGGFVRICESGDLALYENRKVLPTGYISYMKFSPEYNSLKTGDIIKKISETDGAERTGRSILLNLKNKKNIFIPITPSDKKRIIMITMRVVNRQKKDIHIVMNREKNTLSDKRSRYFNGNNTFHFTLKLHPGTDRLKLILYPGKYTISDLKISSFDYSDYTSWRKSVSPWHMKLYSDNMLSGDVTAKKNGIMKISIPYDKGFTLFSDGKKIKISKDKYGFISAHITKGSHHVKLVFHAPLKREGIIISLTGLLIFITTCILRRFNIL